MITAEKAKQLVLEVLLEGKMIAVTEVQETTGLDVYNFSGAVTELTQGTYIFKALGLDGIEYLSITSKGLNYLLKLKATEVKDSVKSSETAKTLKVVGKVAGRKLGSLGNKISNATYNFSEGLTKKINELEKEEAERKATKSEKNSPVKSETDAEIIAKILKAKEELEKENLDEDAEAALAVIGVDLESIVDFLSENSELFEGSLDEQESVKESNISTDEADVQSIFEGLLKEEETPDGVEEPVTVEELEGFLKKFKQEFPDSEESNEIIRFFNLQIKLLKAITDPQ